MTTLFLDLPVHWISDQITLVFFPAVKSQMHVGPLCLPCGVQYGTKTHSSYLVTLQPAGQPSAPGHHPAPGLCHLTLALLL